MGPDRREGPAVRRRVAWFVGLVVAIVWAPPAMADAIYGGSTTRAKVDLEAFVLRADVPGGTVKSVVLAWVANCDNNRSLPFSAEVTVRTVTPGFQPPPDSLVLDSNEPGRFSGRANHASTFDDGSIMTATTTIEGTLRERTTRGTLSVEATVTQADGSNPLKCATGKVRWTGSRGKRRIYGGVTQKPAEPVVIRLDRRATRVSEMMFGWDTAACTTDESFRSSDWLANFPLKARRFRGKFRQEFPDEDGTSEYRYDLVGRVTGTRARGRFSIIWTQNYTDRTPKRVCRTGNVSWTARSG
jgi:hypothetical protein